MATLQIRNDSYRILFCYHGKRRTFTEGKVEEKEADLLVANVERILLRVEQGLLRVPPGVDIVTFVQNDGRVSTADVDKQLEEISLRQLKSSTWRRIKTERWRPTRSPR